MQLRKMYARAAKAYDRHGLGGCVRLGAVNLLYYQPRARLRRAAAGTGSAFDTLYGTETEAIREIGSLEITSRNARDAVRYQPVDEKLFEAIIAKLPIDFTRFTFVDYGSGKGRALLLASRQPFREVVGIEFAPELHAVAEKNIARLGMMEHGCRNVRSVCRDVLDFEAPAGGLVCYFYNPFGRSVMRRVIEKLSASVRASRRDVLVIYVEPLHQDLFMCSGQWNVRETGPNFVVLGSV